MLESGMILKDSYRVLEEIGAGGGGVVYKAYHERLQTYVVVKKIKESVKARLDSRAEADILKKIKHTYLPRVYDFLELDGEVYTIMDYIPGKSISQVLSVNQKFPQKQVLKWAVQLCEALDYLHRQNPPIIHSDIKPANIMLTPQGDICLIDFNISLVFDKNRSNSLGISGGYSPPEQFQSRSSYWTFASTEQFPPASHGQDVATEVLPEETGITEIMETDVTEILEEQSGCTPMKMTETIADAYLGKGVTERSDVYSLGATLYHMTTGIRPSYNYERIVPVSQCGVEISQGFAYIIEKAMNLDPMKRYSDAQEMLSDLKNIVKLDQRYRSFVRKKRRAAGILAAMYLVSAAVTCNGAIVFYQEKETAYHEAIQNADGSILQNEFDAAQVQIDTAIGLFENRIDAYYEKAFLLFSAGDYERCIDYCTDVINTPKYKVRTDHDQKKYADIWFLAANSYYELEDYPNANQCFENAIQNYTQNSEYYRDYAISLVRVGRVEEAEAILEEAKALGLAKDSIYMVSGEIAYAKSRYEEAEEYLNQAIESAQSQGLKIKAYKLSAQAYKKMGNAYLGKEILLLERAVGGEAVSQLNLVEMLGEAYARKAKSGGGYSYYKKALGCFDQLLESGYTSYQTMENIAIIQQQMNQLPEAEATLNQLLEKYSDDYRVYKRLAFLEADKQQTKANEDRDYHKMNEYYEKASKYYGPIQKNGNTDSEMMMLDQMISEIEDGGWL